MEGEEELKKAKVAAAAEASTVIQLFQYSQFPCILCSEERERDEELKQAKETAAVEAFTIFKQVSLEAPFTLVPLQ